MEIGYIGLGKMGLGMVQRLLEAGHKVVAWNRSREPREEAKRYGARVADTIEELVNALTKPRVVWLMLPAGEITEQHIKKVAQLLDKGDLVIDGGNSFFKDSMRRAKSLSEKGIGFMDVGTSGGPGGARAGACLMIGGQIEDFNRLKNLFQDIAAPEAYELLGNVGAGHFAKMVHNGIEYGMMEAIGEGAAVLTESEFDYDLEKVFDLYNRRSVVESRLVGWAKTALSEDPELSSVTSEIAHSGEGEWTVQTAKEQNVPIPVIEESFKVRVRSARESKENPKVVFRNKMVSALRGQFGGHAVKKDTS
ncbi:MAG: decarboxylating 6-phosphogluconate dehydrogenase [bacterium]|nr:decarboxylating 6-phosphogluconate dehydrogenase [bacterium]